MVRLKPDRTPVYVVSASRTRTCSTGRSADPRLQDEWTTCDDSSFDCSMSSGVIAATRTRSRGRIASRAARGRTSPSGSDPGRGARGCAARHGQRRARARTSHRDARSFVWLDDLRRDFVTPCGRLRRHRASPRSPSSRSGWASRVNNTFFTIVNAICLRGLPIEAPERVMYLSRRAMRRAARATCRTLEFDALRIGAAELRRCRGVHDTLAVTSPTTASRRLA